LLGPIGRVEFDLGQCGFRQSQLAFRIIAAERMMRAACLIAGSVLFATVSSAEAESRWLESGRLHVSEIGSLCKRVQGIRLLARMQIISSGDDRWRRLSRQELVMEDAAMGVSPLDPSRCYVVARAGPAGENERRAFEVRDFTLSTELTSVFIVGRAYDAPPVRE
jgi:hypothetical protein